ncbi:MAG: IS110 family transposase [Deltaproteobacteria bacterium]|nr:IS110 family transposase [Deltaproteobacteria bacterium]
MNEAITYDNYIAIDWAQETMAIARMTNKQDKIKVFEGPSDVRGIREFLKGLRGTKILTIEESTASQWLYTEFREHVDRLLVCDPYRNRLLSEGAKNDKIDATKLVRLLRSDMLKEVFHSGDEFIYLRKIVSGYDDLIRSGVQAKNQRSALLRAIGKSHKKDSFPPELLADKFVLDRLERRIEDYKTQKAEYEREFQRLCKKHKSIKNLKTIPGIGDIHAVQIAATVVDAKRFENQGRFLSYCGLVKLERMSGGKSYGKKSPRYNRAFKHVFKMASQSVIQAGVTNPMHQFYEYLINEKKKSEYIARHTIARKIAVLSYGILKTNKAFDLKKFGGTKKTEKDLVRS